MELIKYKENKHLLRKFENKSHLNHLKRLVDYIMQSKNIYFIMIEDSVLGFVHIKFLKKVIAVKMYLIDPWHEQQDKLLLNCIYEIAEGKDQEYITFFHLFDSVKILEKFNGIDYGDYYERGTNHPEEMVNLGEEFKIVKTAADLQESIKFHEICFQSNRGYMQNDWSKLLKWFRKNSYPKFRFFCYSGADIVGASMGYLYTKINKKYLYSICVHPDYRRKYIGEHLLKLFLSSKPIKPCYLNVFRSATPAIKLYKKLGFEKVKTHAVITSRADKISLD